ncbi:hypothetical protein RBSH_02864 [Rhodopirellula baltica SH28]|uniref:Uncharacterized protein n=1 Tax=Rhodopirellula baltica SH28 TaxID=993517 RepID=K5E7R4_RHOBT|nr:hypothetical protein RBSH_02864 [Rhodopirellula baltica SH28]
MPKRLTSLCSVVPGGLLGAGKTRSPLSPSRFEGFGALDRSVNGSARNFRWTLAF